jgi:ABC-2 type transport system permease protein
VALHRIAAVVLRQFYLLRGSPARILPLFAWVAIDMVLWGFISKYLNSVASAGFNFVPMLLGAVLLWDFMVRVMQGIALGILGSAIVLRLGPAAEWFIWPIPALLSPLAGVFYPLSTLPHWMRFIARLLPASYVFEGMRAVIARRELSASPLLFGAGLAVLYLLLVSWVFGRVFRHAVRTGLIARYTAETAG